MSTPNGQPSDPVDPLPIDSEADLPALDGQPARRVAPEAEHSQPTDPHLVAPGPFDANQSFDPAEQPTVAAGERSSVGRNSAVMASGTLVSRVLGLVRTSLTGAAIGLGTVGDAFNGANQLPNYLFLLLSGGLLEPVIVPHITKAAKRDDSERYVNQLITVSLGMCLLVTLLATVGAPWLFSVLGLTGPARTLGILFAYICLPQVFFYGVSTVLSQVLNARGIYGPPMWAPALNNVVCIAGLAIFMVLYGSGQNEAANWDAAMAWLFAGTATLGVIAQALILIPPLLKDGFSWRPAWGFPRDELKGISRYTGWTFLALLISTIGGLVILSVTSTMPTKAAQAGVDGFVAGNNVMNYAFMIFMLPQSIIAISVITALFPPMTRAWQAEDRKTMQSLIKQGLDLPAVFLIPATFAIIALASPLVRFIFYGNTEAELDALAPVLIAMTIGMVPMAIQTLQQRYCFASEQGRVNLLFQLVITGTQMIIAYLWVNFGDPRIGVLVIALGQSLAYTLAAVGFAWFARRQLGGLKLAGTLRLFVRLTVASIFSAFAAWGTAKLLLLIGVGWAMQAVALIVGALIFVLIFTVLAKLMHIKEYFDLLNPILRRLHLPTF